jgi:hypothetical protein
VGKVDDGISRFSVWPLMDDDVTHGREPDSAGTSGNP